MYNEIRICILNNERAGLHNYNLAELKNQDLPITNYLILKREQKTSKTNTYTGRGNII